ncbi:MAG: amino acid transporter substrate-binding protein [Rhodospirillales bacterium]|nr:amino acid transporter substrate-binding protein [Rhodospirillales bacterium]
MLALLRKYIYALGLSLFCSVSHSAAAETWTMVSEDDVPPFVSLDKGHKVGLDVDLLGTVLHEAGVDAEHRGLPWNRVLQMLDRGKVDLGFPFVASPEYSARYILVGPIRLGRSALVGVAGTRIEFKEFNDLKRFVVATVQGYDYSPAFDQAAGLRKDQTATSQLLLLRKLIAERDDLIAGDADTLKMLAEREGVTRRVAFLPHLIEEAPRYVAFPRDRADKAERFRTALERVRARGDLDPILARWHDRHSDAPEMEQ